MDIVNIDWLEKNLNNDDVIILDCSWHLPNANRSGEKEFFSERIPGAIFFNIDDISDSKSPYPHMIPNEEEFSLKVSNLGISNDHHIIAYDTLGIFSSARVYWIFKQYGHKKISILNGGLKYWKWYQDAADVVGETQFWIYDEATMVWSSMPSTDDRFYSSAVTDGNIAIFAGGLSMASTPSSILDGFSLSDAYEIYDSQTDTWTTGNLPAGGGARAKISACHCNGYFVFVGGSIDHHVGSPKINIYNIQTDTWTSQNMAGGTRAMEDCAVAGDKILFAGGIQHNLTYHHGGIFPYARIEVFDSQTQTFSVNTLVRPLFDFRMASYGRRAAASPGVGSDVTPWQYTAYNEIQVFEDASWVNSIKESPKNNISIFPNPTKENITISVENFNGNIKTEVFDLIGNKLQISTETTISLSDYAKGVYIFKITYANKVSELKVIKE